MEAERWKRAEELFHAALEKAPGDRRAFLDDACGADGELRRQVDVLLEKDAEAGSFLESTTTHAAGLLIGRELGPYRIVSPLGAGGMGEVYRAHDGKLGRDVAIKTLPAEFARNEDRLARFRREARTLASLNHPNVAAIYGLEESGDVDCLVLELVEGETLHGPMPMAAALDCARQVAEGLEAAHARGIIHRDLKPANVKITPEGRVKILDFGLAKAVWGSEQNRDLSKTATMAGGETMAGHIIGTPGYMSPEQASGGQMDQRTDVWAFGCLLYELLSGKRAFAGATTMETIAAVLERPPDWSALPAKTPSRIRELLRQCLEKDTTKRLPNIAAARVAIAQEQRGGSRWVRAALPAAVVTILVVGALWWMRGPAGPVDRSLWTRVTNFPDSVTQPALSPDGKMVTFLRGDAPFIGVGQVYVKMLPDGEPVQLTHDAYPKMSPQFSPDGTKIAYTVYRTATGQFSWDTWVVPTMGGEPQEWLKNASGLIWTNPHQLMFSEIKKGLHMGVVSAEENRMAAHDIYLPPPEPSMAHRSYLSPDRKWVLLSEMDEDHLWLPCRVLPADRSSQGFQVGPSGGGCTEGAWTPDSKWVYVTSNVPDANHIWRQRIPNGKPEQVTSGPTEEQGVAMAPDGRSLITAVAIQNSSLWIHDGMGDRQVSMEGKGAQPRITPDGKKLLYRTVTVPAAEWAYFRDPGEIHIVDLQSGRSEVLVSGMKALNYDLSPDGREVAMEVADAAGKARIWIAPLDRGAAPQQIPGVEGRVPKFLEDGTILFRHVEGVVNGDSAGFMYAVRRDGTGLRKVIGQPILLVGELSADRKWLGAWAPVGENGPPGSQFFPLDGGPPVFYATAILANFALDGRSMSMWAAFGFPIPDGKSYVIPLEKGQPFPKVPAGGYRTEEQISSLPGARRVDSAFVMPGPGKDVYASYRGSSLRNLYRVPIQ